MISNKLIEIKRMKASNGDLEAQSWLVHNGLALVDTRQNVGRMAFNGQSQTQININTCIQGLTSEKKPEGRFLADSRGNKRPPRYDKLFALKVNSSFIDQLDRMAYVFCGANPNVAYNSNVYRKQLLYLALKELCKTKQIEWKVIE